MNQDSEVLRQPKIFIVYETQTVCFKMWRVILQIISYKVQGSQNPVQLGSATNYFQENKNLKKKINFFLSLHFS